MGKWEARLVAKPLSSLCTQTSVRRVLLICGALGHTDSEFVQKQEDTEWIIFNCDTPHLMEGVQMDTLFRKISAGPDMLVLISKQVIFFIRYFGDVKSTKIYNGCRGPCILPGEAI